MELSGCAHIDSNTAATGAVPIRDTLAAKVIINSTMKVLQIALLCLATAANGFVVNPKSGSTRTAPSTKLNISGGVNPQEEMYDGVRIGPPPDLPSLLLHNRIVYIGMPLVPAVSELVIAELLYLNYEDSEKPITMYINSSGTTTADGRAIGFETEAFAIADVMRYVRPPVQTVALGQAFGAAAMLLAQGKRGRRFSLPNATIMLTQPKSMARGQASDIAIKAREVAENRKTICSLLAEATSKPLETIVEDCSRTKYLQPHEAVEYGLIDKVMTNESTLPVTPSFIKQLDSW